MAAKQQQSALDVTAEVIQEELGTTNPQAQSRDEIMRLIGHHEAFGLMAGKTTAVWAETLKRLKEQKAYKAVGLTWDEFCPQMLNVSRATADRVIADLNEFGATYFALSQVTRLTRDRYRLVAGQITEDGKLDLGGELVPITKANTDRIREYLEGVELQQRQQSEELSRARSTATKLKQERDLLKKSNQALTDENQQLKQPDNNLYKQATPLERRMLTAQEHFEMAARILDNVRQEDLSELEQKKLVGLGHYMHKVIIASTGDDPMDGMFESMMTPRNLIEEELQADKPTRKQ